MTSFSIFALGLVMIFSTTSAEILDHALDKSTHHALLKQILYAMAGGFLGYLVWSYGYLRLLQISPVLLIIFSILLALALVPGIGREVNGSRRWIHLAGFSIQPSEFVKYLVPMVFIQRVLMWKGQELTFWKFFRGIVPLGVPLFLILVEPNNGTVGVIVVTLMMLFLLTRIPLKYWAIPVFCIGLAGVGFASQLPYVQGRLKVYLNPELDIRGKGHQPHQAKIAAGSGGVFGKGPGNSWQKLSYLPEAQNDYIGAIYAEEFGFSGVLLLIFFYMLFATIGFSIGGNCQELGGFYLAVSVTFLITFQAFLNLGVVSGLLPSTGLNLPLFSQGGSSLIANFMGLGILQSIIEKKTKRFHNHV
jgi:cell division protein FtsW